MSIVFASVEWIFLCKLIIKQKALDKPRIKCYYAEKRKPTIRKSNLIGSLKRAALGGNAVVKDLANGPMRAAESAGRE